MNAHAAYAAVRKHAMLVVRVAVLSALIALLASYVYSEKYEATTILQLRAGQPGTTLSNQETAAFLGADDPYETLAETNAKLIESRQVAQRVVEMLDLDEPTAEQTSADTAKRWIKRTVKDTWTYLRHGYIRQADELTGAVGEVEKAVTVQAVRPTYLLAVSAQASDPELAAQIANTTVEAFTAIRRETLEAENNELLVSVDGRLSEKKNALAAAQQALTEFRVREDVASLPEEVASRIQGIVELEIAKTRTGSVSRVSQTAANAQIDEYAVYLERVPAIQMELDALRMDADAASADYQAVLGERQAAAREAITYQGEISIVDKAYPPLYPIGPIRIYWAGLAALVGLLFALAYVLVGERIAPHDSGDETAEGDLAMPSNRTVD